MSVVGSGAPVSTLSAPDAGGGRSLLEALPLEYRQIAQQLLAAREVAVQGAARDARTLAHVAHPELLHQTQAVAGR